MMTHLHYLKSGVEPANDALPFGLPSLFLVSSKKEAKSGDWAVRCVLFGARAAPPVVQQTSVFKIGATEMNDPSAICLVRLCR